MQGTTEIKIKDKTYGIRFNNLAIGELTIRFGIDPIKNPTSLNSIYAILKLIYCGMIAHSERSGEQILSYSEFLDANENEEIDNEQFAKILESFTVSREVSKAIQLPNEPKDADKKKVKKLPLVKPVS